MLFRSELTGPEYAAVYEEKVKERNIQVYYEATVTAVTPDRIVTAQSREGILKFQAKAVILAMGCRERSRGALNICGSRPAGASFSRFCVQDNHKKRRGWEQLCSKKRTRAVVIDNPGF